MKAVVFHGPGDVRVEEVPEPTVQHPEDAVVQVTMAAICGTDLHPYRGTRPLPPGTIMGHEFVGIVAAVGPNVRNLRPGDRVLVPATIGCGYCAHCTAGLFAHCLTLNPNGRGTAYFGTPRYPGGQAELVRVPFATVGPVPIPSDMTDEQAILLTDALPTGYFAVRSAGVRPGDSVAVFGVGPVGLSALECARLLGAARIFAIDGVAGRLDLAARRGFETVNFLQTDSVQAVMDLTGGMGVDVAIDAVGLDARCQAGVHHPPDAHDDRSQALRWAAAVTRPYGRLGVVGAYGDLVDQFPIGEIYGRNLSLNGGVCHHRTYIPELLQHVRLNNLDPLFMVTDTLPLEQAPEAYRLFDQEPDRHVKILLETPAGPRIPG